MESTIEREPFDFMDFRGFIDQNYQTNKEREHAPNVHMKIMYEMMKRLNIMNYNMMTHCLQYRSSQMDYQQVQGLCLRFSSLLKII